MANFLEEAYMQVWDKITGWLQELIIMLPNFAIASIILLLFVIASRYISRLSTQLIKRIISPGQTIERLICNTVRLTIIGIGLFISLEILKLDKAVTSFLAGAGIIGLALGFAFQDITANFISGVIMAFRKPFVVGDFLESQGVFGQVKRIDLRHTLIEVPQGQLVIIPNKDIYQNVVRNFSTGRRRIDLEVGVAYDSDLEQVEEVAVEAIEEIKNLRKTSPVRLHYKEFGGSSINFVIQYWIDFNNPQDYMKAVSEGIKRIKNAFDRVGINIPFPIRTLHVGSKDKQLIRELTTTTLNEN